MDIVLLIKFFVLTELFFDMWKLGVFSYSDFTGIYILRYFGELSRDASVFTS
jgi:hypothetical protein